MNLQFRSLYFNINESSKCYDYLIIALKLYFIKDSNLYYLGMNFPIFFHLVFFQYEVILLIKMKYLAL